MPVNWKPHIRLPKRIGVFRRPVRMVVPERGRIRPWVQWAQLMLMVMYLEKEPGRYRQPQAVARGWAMYRKEKEPIVMNPLGRIALYLLIRTVSRVTR